MAGAGMPTPETSFYAEYVSGVSAVRLMRPFRATRSGGEVVAGNAGDFLLVYADGAPGVSPPEEFHRKFRPCTSRPAPDDDEPGIPYSALTDRFSVALTTQVQDSVASGRDRIGAVRFDAPIVFGYDKDTRAVLVELDVLAARYNLADDTVHYTAHSELFDTCDATTGAIGYSLGVFGGLVFAMRTTY